MIASRATGTGEASHLRISNDFAIWARNGGCLLAQMWKALSRKALSVPRALELHEAICKSFNRGLGYHLYQFSYPIQSYAAKTTGMKKADVLEWCLAFGVPTEGLKVPEMKASSVRFKRAARRRTSPSTRV